MMDLETALQRIKNLEAAIEAYLASGPHLHGDVAVEAEVERCPRCQAYKRLEETMKGAVESTGGKYRVSRVSL